MTLAVEVVGLRKAFGSRKVLEKVDLRVARGEAFALVGPSGAGKTTLLRCIDFLLTPDAGVVRFDGAESPTVPLLRLALRRRIGFVAQNPFLFRGTVFHNVSYGLCVRGVENPALSERTSQALSAVGLSDRTQSHTSGLSAGEAQRVALARAIVVRPELLLLDEFTANLDPANVAQLEKAIAAYHAESGATILAVTHNLFQARRLASRAGLLLGGEIVESADVATFFSSPVDPRTRAFVSGEMAY